MSRDKISFVLGFAAVVGDKCTMQLLQESETKNIPVDDVTIKGYWSLSDVLFTAVNMIILLKIYEWRFELC